MRTPSILILMVSLLFTGCPEETIITPINSLQLSVEDVGCTEALLLITVGSQEKDRTVSLKRGDSVIAVITMAGVDSLFTDTGLIPNRSYSYTLTNQSFTASTSLTTPDTTSHAVQWALPDTLGAMGVIRDVWVFSENDAWAVGEIYLADSNGKPNMEIPYNAAHWNGTMWKVKSIKVNYHGNMITPTLTGIIAFSPTDIWTSSGVPVHGDGVSWTQYHLFDMGILPSNDGSLNKLWGPNTSNMFYVGNKGTIVHYFNGVWTKQQSNTTVDLQDIWGIDESHVWASGRNTADGRSVVLEYDGKSWRILYDNLNKPPLSFYAFKSVWTDRPDRIFLAGGSHSHVLKLKENVFQNMNIPQQEWVAFNLRGLDRRDLFQVGSGAEIFHFNGAGWNKYVGLPFNNISLVGFNSVSINPHFILVGGIILNEFNGVPVVLRGYR